MRRGAKSIMEMLIMSNMLSTGSIQLPRLTSQLMEDAVDNLCKINMCDRDNLPLVLAGAKYVKGVSPVEQWINKDKSLLPLTETYEQYVKTNTTGEPVDDAALSIAKAILVYYRQNINNIYTIGNKQDWSIAQVLSSDLSRMPDINLLTLIEPFLMPIVVSDNVVGPTVVEQKVLVPPNFKVSEAAIQYALMDEIRNTKVAPTDIGAKLLLALSMLMDMPSGVKSVYYPTDYMCKVLIGYFVKQRLTENMLTLHDLIAQYGYILPNLMQHYDQTTLQSYYATADNMRIHVVQWSDNFTFKGSVVMPDTMFQTFFTFGKRFEIKDTFNYNGKEFKFMPVVGTAPLPVLFDVDLFNTEQYSWCSY